MSESRQKILALYSTAITVTAIVLGIRVLEPDEGALAVPRGVIENCSVTSAPERESARPQMSIAPQFILPPLGAGGASGSEPIDALDLRIFAEQQVKDMVDRYVKVTPEQRERLMRAAMAQITLSENDGLTEPGQAPSSFETEEEILGKQKALELIEARKKRADEAARLGSERTLYQLVDALGLELSPGQKDLALNLLSNQENSTDITADQEVSFLSHRLSLSGSQTGKVREVLSQIYAMNDDALAGNSSNGEMDTAEMRNRTIVERLSKILSPQQIEELKRIQELEAG